MPLPPRLRRPPTARISLVLWALLLTGAWAQQPAAPSAKPTFEEWTLFLLDGKTCGFGSTITTAVQAPQGLEYRTELQQEFVVRRMGAPIKMSEISHITENAQGVVLAFDQTSTGVGSNIESRGVRKGDDLVVSSRGQTRRYHIPPLAALGPEAIRRLTNAVPLQPGTNFTLNTFTTDYPEAVAVENGTIVDLEEHKVGGVKRKLWKITSEMPVMPGITSVTWVDESNNDVATEVTIPGLGQIEQLVSSRSECMKQPEGAEIFAGTLIAPQRALANIDDQGQAIFRLTVDETTRKLSLWDHGEQRVLKSRPGMTEIEVTVPTWTASDATFTLPHADTPDLRDYLQPSAYLESGSPIIRRLAKEAVDGETNPVLAARRIEKFVEMYITKKDLNIGFASAEETAMSREGDCTEHAVLCAALGRAVGLPTRCVLGFGYISPGDVEPTITDAVDMKTGIFGFHMWAEACIGPDRWVPMDAALGGFDVGHIAIFKSALADIDPMVDLNMPILALMKNLHIEVLKTVRKEDLGPQPADGSVHRNLPAVPPPILRVPATMPAASAPAPSRID